MSDISWSFSVSIAGGPAISSSQTTTVEAYDEIDVKIPGAEKAKAKAVPVEIQPGNKVKFLLISSDRYGADLTYTVKGGGVSGVVLDNLQLLAGAGAISLLGKPVKTVEFTNGLGDGNDASIKIIVGRDTGS